MSASEQVARHAASVREAIAQAREVSRLGWPEGVGRQVDRLAYDHAVAAAHTATGGKPAGLQRPAKP